MIDENKKKISMLHILWILNHPIFFIASKWCIKLQVTFRVYDTQDVPHIAINYYN